MNKKQQMILHVKAINRYLNFIRIKGQIVRDKDCNNKLLDHIELGKDGRLYFITTTHQVKDSMELR